MKKARFKLSSYFHFLKMALSSEFHHWPILLGRLGFFGVIMVIFSNLWQAAFESGLRSNGTPSDMLWYLAATEWIVLSTPGIHTQIEDDVRDGTIAYQLGRPYSYLTMRVMEAFGQLLARILTVGVGGFLMAFLASGQGPNMGLYFPVFLLLGFLAGLASVMFQAAIGMVALWLKESTPLFWIWQKLLFLFGGLIVPLSLYPKWLVTVSMFTPFYALLYAPSRLMFGFNLGLALGTLCLLLVWILVAYVLLRFLNEKIIRAIVIDGG